LLLICALGASALASCNDDSPGQGKGGGGGGTGVIGSGGIGGMSFNQCGVAAPLPRDTGQCMAVSAPTITDFDDYSGTGAGSYTYYVNGKPPAANAVLGGIVHVGDGSDMNGGTSAITTEMVTGVGDAGYALQIANTNAVNWGGLLMFYFTPVGSTATCLNAGSYRGVEFSIKGASPSGRFGVVLGMLDTDPLADRGLCDNASAADCKPATLELALPADATTWAQFQVPWSSLTPGVGSAISCVPVTGQNIVRLVIQPFMRYPPPAYMLEPGPYAIAVDNVRFY
jgi:hypothetical protein